MSKLIGNLTLSLAVVLCIDAMIVRTAGAQFTQRNQNTASQQQQQRQTGNQRQAMTPQQQQALQQLQQQQLQQQQQQRLPQTMPQPFGELSQAHIEYLDKLLAYWETNSSKIDQYQSEFTRFVYDQAFLNKRDPRTGHIFARQLAQGVIKFSDPDKAMYEVNKIWKFEAPPAAAGEEPKYQKLDENWQEKWICDGKSIYEYKFQDKQVVQRALPPEMQGERITNGPLPFLFGAKADEMKKRYWIRYITPPNVKNEYWIEAYPKSPIEARDMLKVEVVLAAEDFLPKAITVYEANHNPGKDLVRKSTFEFKNRKTKVQGGLPQFLGNLKPNVPLGWKKIEEPIRAAQSSQQSKNGLQQK